MSALLYGMNAGLGFSPHTLGMIMKTMLSGRRSGLIFLLSGVLVDVLLISLAWGIKDQIELGTSVQRLMRIGSGALIIRMGYKAYFAKVNPAKSPAQGSSWGEGFLLQLTNPNPYIFWFLVGVPLLLQLKSDISAVEFVLTFMLVTYGIKALIVELCARLSKEFIFNSVGFKRLRMGVAGLTLVNGSYLILTEIVR